MTISHAIAAVLARLEARRIAREEELAGTEEQRQVSANQENDDDAESPNSPAPIFDKFVNSNGEEAIKTLTNFTATEFNILWSQCESDINARWYDGR